MKIDSSYSVKIKHYNRIFCDTVNLYRKAVDFFIEVCLAEWSNLSTIAGKLAQQRYIELQTHRTKNTTWLKYDFDNLFYKFPSYLRRAAISAAIGKVSSYKSNLANYEASADNRKPSVPKAGKSFPVMYRDNCFVRTGTYTARLKVFIRNTWDWLDVEGRCGLHPAQMPKPEGMRSCASQAGQGVVPGLCL